jgi:hypothetical protein
VKDADDINYVTASIRSPFQPDFGAFGGRTAYKPTLGFPGGCFFNVVGLHHFINLSTAQTGSRSREIESVNTWKFKTDCKAFLGER